MAFYRVIRCVDVAQADKSALDNGPVSLSFNGFIFMYGVAEGDADGLQNVFAEAVDLVGYVFMEWI